MVHLCCYGCRDNKRNTCTNIQEVGQIASSCYVARCLKQHCAPRRLQAGKLDGESSSGRIAAFMHWAQNWTPSRQSSQTKQWHTAAQSWSNHCNTWFGLNTAWGTTLTSCWTTENPLKLNDRNNHWWCTAVLILDPKAGKLRSETNTV